MARENGAAIRRRETNGMTKAPGLERLEPRNIFYIIIRSVVTGFRLSRASRSFSFNSLAVSLPFFLFFFHLPYLFATRAIVSFLPFPFHLSQTLPQSAPRIRPSHFLLFAFNRWKIYLREILEEARRSSSQTPPSILNVIAIDIYIGLCFPGREKLKESFVRVSKKGGGGEKKKGRNASSSNGCSTSEIDFAYIICSVLFCLFPLGRNLEALFESRRFGISR